MRLFAPLILILVLSACAETRTRCLTRANAELTALDNEIVETEVAIIRGYRVAPRSQISVGVGVCTSNDPVRFCASTRHPVYERREPVDPGAERLRLAELKARRPAVAAAAEAAAASCPAS